MNDFNYSLLAQANVSFRKTLGPVALMAACSASMGGSGSYHAQPYDSF